MLYIDDLVELGTPPRVAVQGDVVLTVIRAGTKRPTAMDVSLAADFCAAAGWELGSTLSAGWSASARVLLLRPGGTRRVHLHGGASARAAPAMQARLRRHLRVPVPEAVQATSPGGAQAVARYVRQKGWVYVFWPAEWGGPEKLPDMITHGAAPGTAPPTIAKQEDPEPEQPPAPPPEKAKPPPPARSPAPQMEGRTSAPKSQPAPPRPAPSAAATSVAAAHRAMRSGVRSTNTVPLAGEPEPGRSALDRRGR